MKKITLFLIILISSSCSNYFSGEISGNESACLSEKEIDSIATAKIHEDFNKIFNHYQYCNFDLNKLIYYLELSINSGFTEGYGILSDIYLNGFYGYKITENSCHRGIYLLQKINKEVPDINNLLIDCMNAADNQKNSSGSPAN